MKIPFPVFLYFESFGDVKNLLSVFKNKNIGNYVENSFDLNRAWLVLTFKEKASELWLMLYAIFNAGALEIYGIFYGV